MIDSSDAETALEFLRESAAPYGRLVEQARLRESKIKHVKALLMKKWNESTIGAQEREAMASKEYLDCLIEDAQAAGELERVKAERKHAEITVSLYQTKVRERL